MNAYPILYAVTENPADGFQGGAVNIFKPDMETKRLDLLTKVDSFGQAPCHLTVDPQNGTILMADLGLDAIYVREYNSESRAFQENADLKTPPDSDCRHAVFPPDANVLYVVGELDCPVSVFERNRDGLFEGPIQTVSSLAEDAKPNETPFTASAICIHPSGKKDHFIPFTV